jgi:hypothetical protein
LIKASLIDWPILVSCSLNVRERILISTQAVQCNVHFFSFLELFGTSNLPEKFSASGKDSLFCCGEPPSNCVPVGLEDRGSVQSLPVSSLNGGRSIVHGASPKRLIGCGLDGF